jgi:hypothetical protein
MARTSGNVATSANGANRSELAGGVAVVAEIERL